jgi:hypothetical protein
LHAAGILHCDVKPTNALVRPDGRLVLLDFGLATEVDLTGRSENSTGQVTGTPGYMAPEQAAGETVTSAADWYAVGVVLYQFLAGRLPFVGGVLEVLRDKQASDPRPPSEYRAQVPENLEQLCLELLARDPARRPSGPEVLRRLEVVGAVAAVSSRPTGPELVGRSEHLFALSRAYDATSAGVPVVARVSGPSGSGKSALAREFLRAAFVRGAVTLAGRCYEHELVPFKAFDEVIDALSRHLADLPETVAAAVLPREVGLLVRLFPALARVPVVAAAPRGRDVPDQREARRRGIAALRELFGRLGDRGRVVVLIDDLQWGDADSQLLLDELLRPPDAPVLFLVVCFRSEDADTATLRSIRQLADAPADRRVVDVPVDPLSAADAQALVERLLPSRGAETESVVRESGGNPFFICELAEAIGVGLTVGPGASLDEVVWERIRGLPPDARRYLEVVAVAGRPIPSVLVRRAVGTGENWQSVETALRSGRFIRGTAGERVAPYHDRVREAVLANVTPDDRREHHLHLAQAAEVDVIPDTEFLAVHYHAAGNGRIAAGFYAAAGAAAAAATAFDQAARLYRLAVELGEWRSDELVRLRVGEAEALANAGRGAAAADVYLHAAELDGGDAAVEWRRRAAEQFLITGHIDVGLAVCREVVASVGMTFPRTRVGAVAGLLVRRLWLRLRGTGSRRRTAESVPAGELRAIDVCWSAATGLSVTDFILGAHFQIRGLLRALATGEPSRIARALALEGAHAAVNGPSADARSIHLIEAAEAVASHSVTSYTSAMLALARGMREYLAGRFRGAVGHFAVAEQIFRDACTGVTWELDSARIWRLWCHCSLGELGNASADWSLLFNDAMERGDLFAGVNLGTWISAYVRVAADDTGAAWTDLRAVMGRWSQQGFHVQHHNELTAQVLLLLYEGDGEAAWESVRDKEGLYRRAMLWRVQQIRIDFLQTRARAALAAASRRTTTVLLLKSAERDATALGRESAGWAKALGALMGACVRTYRPDPDGPEGFALAARLLDAADLGAYAAAARYREGERIAGEEGAHRRDVALAWMTAEGVRNPLRLIDIHAPVANSRPGLNGAETLHGRQDAD